jgi:hypothetical protein
MKKIIIFPAVLMAPFAVHAAGADLQSTIEVLWSIVVALIPITSTAAFLFFFWGLAKYILDAGNFDKKEEGKEIMTWGLLAIFLLVTIWGTIGFLQQTVGNTGGPGEVQVVIPRF